MNDIIANMWYVLTIDPKSTVIFMNDGMIQGLLYPEDIGDLEWLQCNLHGSMTLSSYYYDRRNIHVCMHS